MQIGDNNVVGNGSFSLGAISPNRDVSGTGGLMSGPTSFAFTVNADGTLSGASLAGATNSTPASPGKTFSITTTNAIASVRLFEP